MTKYRITLGAYVPTYATVEVDADSLEEAEKVALRLGSLDEVEWHDSDELDDMHVADGQEIKEAEFQCIDPNCPSAGTYHDHGGDK